MKLTREQLLEKTKEELVEIIINLEIEIDCIIDSHAAELNGAYEYGSMAAYKEGYREAENAYRY